MSVNLKPIYYFLLCFFLLNLSLSLRAQVVRSKQAGVCFRFDDFQDTLKLQRVNDIFKKHGLNYTYAANLSSIEIYGQESHWNVLKKMAADGNEIADQTPNDHSQFFETKTLAVAKEYEGKAGIDHIYEAKNRVCLKVKLLKNTGFGDEGKVRLSGDMVISNSAGEFSWQKLSSKHTATHFYLPASNKVFIITRISNANSGNADTVWVESLWREPVDLGMVNNADYKKLSQYDLQIEESGFEHMMFFSAGLFLKHQLPAPSTFIHPGGAIPYHSMEYVNKVLTPLGYTNGATYPIRENTIFDYNLNGSKQFNLQGEEFTPESHSFTEMKKIIAGKYACHYVAISINHFGGYPTWNNFDGMINNLDSLLGWIKTNNIPVKTYKQWNDFLLKEFFDPTQDIFPKLQSDLDKDNLPDGCQILNGATLEKTGGVSYSNNYCISANTTGLILSIGELGALTKGKNTFSVSTKGGVDANDAFRLVVNYPEIGSSAIYVVPCNTANYTERSFDVDVPSNVSFVHLQFNYTTNKGQKAYASGFKWRATQRPTLKSQTFFREVHRPYEPIDLSVYGACKGYTQTQLSYLLVKQPNHFTASLSNSGILNLRGKVNRFASIKDSVQIALKAPSNTYDTTWFYLEPSPYAICNGEVVRLRVNKEANDKSYAWSSSIADPFLKSTNDTFNWIGPSQNTTYNFSVTKTDNSKQESSLAVGVTPASLVTTNFSSKYFNGSNQVQFTLPYDARYRLSFGSEFPNLIEASISGNTVSLNRDPSFNGKASLTLLAIGAGCELTKHTLEAYAWATGLGSALNVKNTHFYPNPLTGAVLKFQEIPSGAKVELYNLNGEMVLQTKLLSNELTVEGLEDAIYLIKIEFENQVFIEKLVIYRGS